jgi:hypothetical protein
MWKSNINDNKSFEKHIPEALFSGSRSALCQVVEAKTLVLSGLLTAAVPGHNGCGPFGADFGRQGTAQ